MKQDEGQGGGLRAPSSMTDEWARAQRLAQMATWSWQPFGSGARWSSELYRILGLAADEGQPAEHFWRCLVADDRGALIRWIARLRRGGLVTSIVVRIQWPGGVLRHVQLQGRAASEEEPGDAWIHGSILDVTENRERDLQLRTLEKMSALGTLAGGIAHDYNNLLQVITGNVELLHNCLGDRDAALDILNELVHATGNCTDLTKRLSSFAQRGALPADAIDLPTSVSRLAKKLQSCLGETIELSIRHDPGRSSVRLDEDALAQLLMNLCWNAREAMVAGGRVIIETGQVEVDQDYSNSNPGISPGAHLRLCVTDDGAGIAANVLQRIFEPFFTTKSRRRGTGLGLSIAYGIVAQAGGHIEASSAEGHGCKIMIYLPLCTQGHLACDGPRTPRAGLQGQGQRVLLVDDEAQVRRLARRVLEREGYQVIEAEDGRQALDIVGRDVEISLLVTDVVMPEMDGVELLRRALGARPELSCVLMSGHTGQCGISPARLHDELGVRVALRKPFTLTELLDAVRQAQESHGHVAS